MNRLVAASLAAAGLGVGFGAAASAADLGRPALAPTYTKAPVVAPISWTGCYLGGSVGGAWSRTSYSEGPGDDDGGNTGSSFVGGGQIGCDYQAGQWVFGAQGMFDWGAIKGNYVVPLDDADDPGTGFRVFNNNKWLATATGRIGYAIQPALLLYGKGGAAWTSINISTADPTAAETALATDNRFGWTFGAGLEYMFAPNWSVFAEYDYLGFGTKTVTGNGLAVDVKQDVQVALVGVNWHFNPR
jgi:outer membrane immunogenic protein